MNSHQLFSVLSPYPFPSFHVPLCDYSEVESRRMFCSSVQFLVYVAVR